MHEGRRVDSSICHMAGFGSRNQIYPATHGIGPAPRRSKTAVNDMPRDDRQLPPISYQSGGTKAVRAQGNRELHGIMRITDALRVATR